MAATMSTQMWIQSARDELREDLPRKDLTRHQLVQEIPETWYCHVPMDLARELPLCGSWTYASPEINLMIAEILTGDRDLVRQMSDIIEEVENLEKLMGGNGMFGGDGDWCWPLNSYSTKAEPRINQNSFIQSEKDVFAWLDDLELISDMEDFVTENQIEECLDYIENVDEDFDPEIEFALLQFEEDFDYEKSLYEENKACEKQQINLHRLLAQEPNARPHWAGQASSEYGDVHRDSHNPYQTDRFTLDVEMITNFPEGKQGGYALGKTPYGLVYFPSKFRGFVEKAYHDDQGALYHTGWYSVTVALRDAASRENDRVKSVFTAVYNHGDLE